MKFADRPKIESWITPTALLVILVLITIVRIVTVNQMPDQGFFAKYIDIAGEILAGNQPIDRYGDLSTGYLWAVVLCLGPLGLEIVTLRTIQIIGVSLAAAICGFAAWRRWSLGAGLGTTAILLASPAALVNATEIEPETMILVLTSIGLSLIISTERPLLTSVAGLALGLAVVTRPSVLLPLVFAIVGLALKARSGQRLPIILPLILGVTIPIVAARWAVTMTTGATPTPMNPGTVLFEGWNPLATGYQGEAPVVVKDIEHNLGLPDGLHVAYRLVAARALDQPVTSTVSNAFWSRKALAFIKYEPLAAFKLAARKAFLGLHSYEAWDLKTLQRKGENLPMGVFVPFGLVVSMALFGLMFGRRDSWAPALGLWLFGSWLVMVLFYVTARQRNVMLPAAALLVGVAVEKGFAAWRAGDRRKMSIGLIATVAAGTLLTVEGTTQREDKHTWHLLAAQEAAAHKAAVEQNEGDRFARLAQGATFLDPVSLRTADPGDVGRAVRGQLTSELPPERYFDLALVLLEVGLYDDAENLLLSLESQGYRPRRGARWCSSTAYHLARCRIMASDISGARSFMTRASEQAPGDPRVLSLEAVLSEMPETAQKGIVPRRALAAMYDPFTAKRALADAYMDFARPISAAPLLSEIRKKLPEWTGPPEG